MAKLVCADCGVEHDGQISDKCPQCGSYRLITLSLVLQLFGEDWREAFNDSDESITGE